MPGLFNLGKDLPTGMGGGLTLCCGTTVPGGSGGGGGIPAIVSSVKLAVLLHFDSDFNPPNVTLCVIFDYRGLWSALLQLIFPASLITQIFLQESVDAVASATTNLQIWGPTTFCVQERRPMSNIQF